MAPGGLALEPPVLAAPGGLGDGGVFEPARHLGKPCTEKSWQMGVRPLFPVPLWQHCAKKDPSLSLVPSKSLPCLCCPGVFIMTFLTMLVGCKTF